MNSEDRKDVIETFVFGDYTVDVENGVLFRDGETVQIQWKTFELLLIFLRAGQRLVKREELIEALWPDSFVEENNISQQIRSLRKVLGDGGIRYIETIPRRGYRFLPEVKRFTCRAAATTVASEIVALGASQADGQVLTNAGRDANSPRSSSAMWPILAVAGIAFVLSLVPFLMWDRGPSRHERTLEYASKIKLAALALESSDLRLAEKLLRETRPSDGEEDLRGFEWGYISRLYSERAASQPITLDHQGWIDDVAFSADGRLIATASIDARVWDVATGDQIGVFAGHRKSISSVAFSPDGSKLATGSYDMTARLWDLATGREIWSTVDTSNGQGIAVGRLEFTADGEWLIGEGHDRSIKFWNVATGVEGRVRSPSLDLKQPFTFSKDGRYLAGQEPDWAVAVFDLQRGKKVARLYGNFGFVTDVRFAPDSQFVMTAGSDGVAKFWKLPDGKLIRSFTGLKDEVAISPDGRTIAIGSEDTIKLLEIENGSEIATLRGHVNNIMSLEFSPDGQRLVSGGGGGDPSAKIWNLPRGNKGLLKGHNGLIRSIAFSPDSKLFASGGSDKIARVWDVESETMKLSSTKHGGDVGSMVFPPNSNTLITGSADGIVREWDVVNGKMTRSFDSLAKDVGVFLSPDGTRLATAHFWSDSNIRLWNTGSGELLCTIPRENVWDIRFSMDGVRFTASGSDRMIRLWETSSCVESWSKAGDPNYDHLAVFRPNGDLIPIQVFNGQKSLKIFDPSHEKELFVINGHESDLQDIDISPDGKRLITIDERGILKIWDLDFGLELLSIDTGLGSVGDTSAAVSPDGKLIAVGGSEGTIRIFRSGEIDQRSDDRNTR